jgi:hypothetical protein
MKRVFSSRAMDFSLPKALRSEKKLEAAKARTLEEAKRLYEKKLAAERRAGLRV